RRRQRPLVRVTSTRWPALAETNRYGDTERVPTRHDLPHTMTDATQQPTATTSKAPMVVCVDSYFADLRATDQWAFTFVPEHGRGRFTHLRAHPRRVPDRRLLHPLPRPTLRLPGRAANEGAHRQV